MFNRWRAAQAAPLKAAEAALQKQAAAASKVNEALLLNLGTNSQASRMLRACRIHSHFQTSPPLNHATLVELEPEFGGSFRSEVFIRVNIGVAAVTLLNRPQTTLRRTGIWRDLFI